MSSPVQDFSKSKKRLLDYFSCKEDYPVKVFSKYKWLINHSDGVYMLSFWDEEENQLDYFVVKKGKDPVIYKTRDYIMIVAVDCVKYGFVFLLSNESK